MDEPTGDIASFTWEGIATDLAGVGLNTYFYVAGRNPKDPKPSGPAKITVADRGPLVAGIPVAGKRPEGMEMQGNFATADYTWLHTEIADPLARIRATQKSCQDTKEHIAASEGADINSLVSLAPQWLTRIIGWAIHRREGKVGIFGNVILSNVPGPRQPLHLGPVKVENWFSTGQIFDGSSVNMTVWSYCGQANLCIFADQMVLPDGWKLFDYFCEELDALIALEDSPKPALQEVSA